MCGFPRLQRHCFPHHIETPTTHLSPQPVAGLTPSSAMCQALVWAPGIQWTGGWLGPCLRGACTPALGSPLGPCVPVLPVCHCEGQCVPLRPLGPHGLKASLQEELCWSVRHPRPSCYLGAPSRPTAVTGAAHSALHAASLLSVLPASRVGRHGWHRDSVTCVQMSAGMLPSRSA